MKYTAALILTVCHLSCIGQIRITGKVIPWKTLDHLDSLKVIIRTSSHELFSSKFSIDEIQGIDGNFKNKIFEYDLEETVRSLEFAISLKYKNTPTSRGTYYTSPEVIRTPLNWKESRIDLEIHFQKYFDERLKIISNESIDKLVLKKIYELSEDIVLVRNWDCNISSIPSYLIQNNGPFLLYGQSGDGNFEGELYQYFDGTLERVPTGGYNLDSEPGKPLFSNNHIVSTIRDHREQDNRYRIALAGKYVYKIYLGFEPYEMSSSFGILPYFSVNSSNNKEKHKIQEYFELSDEFVIK